ncbi:MAG: gfo/Idh/MocA family oxidoreductase [Planctomycetota bacterium]|nr:MAG: gfo/Idh/MocA family oxidoreductase [Planctomycetota bacterium]
MNAKIDRRSFLYSTAAAGAGLMLTPSALARSGGNKNDDINVALLGAGAQGQVLLDSCLKIPGLHFKAVCDIWTEWNQKRVSGQLKAYRHENNTYEDYKEMLDKEKDLDAVIIATPDFWHAEHAIACLEAGLHVYCEKEMSNTLEGARKMVETARKTGKLLQIGHQRRSNPRYIFSYEKIIKEAQMIGRITTINGQWNRSKRACEDLGWPKKAEIDQATLNKYGFESMHQFKNWRWYKGLGGGPIVDLGSHQIDIYSWFLDAQPKSVLASGGIDYWKNHEWYDNVMALYEYETEYGTVRAFYQTLTTNSAGGYFETFMGDKGALMTSENAARNAVYREDWVPQEQWYEWENKRYIKREGGLAQPSSNKAVLDVRSTMPAAKYNLLIDMDKLFHQPHLENFFDAIRGRAVLNCPAEIGYETAVAVLKINEAVEAGRKLEFKPEDFKV